MEKRTSFQQIRDVLGSMKDCHEAVRLFCIEHQFDFGDDQRQLLVAALQEDQQQIENAIEGSRRHPSSRAAVETWIQYVPREQLEASVEHIHRLRIPTFRQLVEAVGNFYQAMAAFISQLRQQAPAEAAGQVLDDLAMLVTQRAKALSQRLAGLDDV